ncbi:MAG: DUF1501 domain-containing protein [Verrucomicrobia bacterium]|nr:DUF1501 domain-containing protein [Verrucomicrobiota bacterium]
MARPCQVSPEVQFVAPDHTAAQFQQLDRRSFLRHVGVTAAGLTAVDFLGYFARAGLPKEDQTATLAKQATESNANPHFLIYWYLEGGWLSYDMFSPVATANNLVQRLKEISQERYRVAKFGEENYGIYNYGNIRYGYLAEPGKDLFADMAVLSSMHTGSFHSGDRLKCHLGDYNFKLTDDRQEDERSVMQAFAEVYGQPYVLPNLSWHWWLSDGELNEVQYTGRKGYYHALGPPHAHTIYAGTPAKLKKFLLQMQADSGDTVNRQIQKFLDGAHDEFLKDDNLEAVKSYHSARQIYLQLAARGMKLDRSMLLKLFNDPALKDEFGVKPTDELITYRSVNGNKARSKFSPNTNVQAMMTYELMRAGLACAFFIESRDIRRFDTHKNRKALWEADRKTPIGQTDQTTMMKQDLWDPLHALVKRLKETPFADGKSSLYDYTTLVINSEFGRTIHGDVEGILKKSISEEEKQKEIDGQDISQHWKVTSCAFLGGQVRGDSQFGRVGEKTLMAIPLMPDGGLDPAYDPVTGELLHGKEKDPKSSIPNHGDVYATALYLSGIDPKGRGRNQRGPLKFIRKGEMA